MVTKAEMGTEAAPTSARVLVTAMLTTLPADKPSPWACKSDQNKVLRSSVQSVWLSPSLVRWVCLSQRYSVIGLLSRRYRVICLNSHNFRTVGRFDGKLSAVGLFESKLQCDRFGESELQCDRSSGESRLQCSWVWERVFPRPLPLSWASQGCRLELVDVRVRYSQISARPT
jgi:hypothetical protein